MEKTASILGLIKKDCLDIQSLIDGIGKQEFLASPQVNMAVTMSLFSIAELSKTLPVEFRTSFPQLPWERVITLNSAAHEKKRLDLEEVWAVATGEINKILRFINSYE
ncbi:MAG: DUF86 domain-containing protein [Firmicutes bacterium]|jgi:uncharacterized protein with HEPN domain|nr:DUF86 domain-containing protein [Bacillota bacterium]